MEIAQLMNFYYKTYNSILHFFRDWPIEFDLTRFELLYLKSELNSFLAMDPRLKSTKTRNPTLLDITVTIGT